MGLITDDAGRYAVLTDIEGIEDFNGDMDFKVAGTRDGITAIQMDTKLKGITLEIVEITLSRSKDARMFILDTMAGAITAPRPDVSKFAPRMTKIKIDQGKIGAVIGTGGKTIRSIIESTKTTIDVADDGTITIGSSGKVSRILNFGAMVEILPGKDGLVHISELADRRLDRVEDEVHIGDEVTVKVISIDDMGRVNLSRRALFEKEGGSTTPQEGEPTADYPFRKSSPGGGSSDFRGNRGGSRPSRGPRPPYKRD
jgi:polyribonucleotide nucleotidyltransferase